MRIINIYDGQCRETLAQTAGGRLTSIITSASNPLEVLKGIDENSDAAEIRDVWIADAIDSGDQDQIAWAKSVTVEIYDLDCIESTDLASA